MASHSAGATGQGTRSIDGWSAPGFTEAEALLCLILDSIAHGVLVLDAELRIRLWNDRIYAMFPGPPGRIEPGRAVEDVIRARAAMPEAAARAIAFLRKAVRLRRPVRTEFRLPAGAIIEAKLTPLPRGGLLCTCLDVTERRTAETVLLRAKEEAELASRSKSEFLANMSHELRTPLNAIIGFADMLRNEIFGPLGHARYHGYVADIHDSGQHLLGLVNDILDVSKIESGKTELTEEPVDMASVIDSCMRLMRDRVHARGLHLARTIPPGLPHVRCDELRMKQIILNLLSNAVKFTPPNGYVAVRVALLEGGLSISIEDSGIGIAPQDIDKALRRFGQIDSRLQRKYEGTGLGLPLSKSMIELHGGRLELRSTPGVGTKAVVWLPRERVLQPADREGAAAA